MNNEAKKSGRPASPKEIKTRKRDSNGLFPSVTYEFLPNGSIDWRAMISPEHIVLSKEAFLRKDPPIQIDQLDEEALEKLKKKAKEYETVILLAGFKELADLRGFTSVKKEIINATNEYACVKVSIDFIANYETGGLPVTYEEVADAHLSNTNNFSQKYLVTIAANRAFSRAVRNFLKIHSPCQDEIALEDTHEASQKDSSSMVASPGAALERKMKEFSLTLEDIKDGFKDSPFASNEKAAGIDTWNSVKSIPQALIPLILTQLPSWRNK